MIIQTTRQMRERDDFDHYPTPETLVRVALTTRVLPLCPAPRRILDPGAGEGVWGKVARDLWPNALIVGTEIRPLPKPDWYDHWLVGNHMKIDSGKGFDLITGNPPYGDLWDLTQRKLSREAKKRGEAYKRPPRPGDEPMAAAEAFVRKAHEQAKDSGIIFYLLRQAFLEGQDRGDGLWKEFCPVHVDTLSKRPSYTANGKTDATAYALFLWQKGARRQNYIGGWLEW